MILHIPARPHFRAIECLENKAASDPVTAAASRARSRNSRASGPRRDDPGNRCTACVAAEIDAVAKAMRVEPCTRAGTVECDSQTNELVFHERVQRIQQ